MLSSMVLPSSLTRMGMTRRPTRLTIGSVSSSRTTVSCRCKPLSAAAMRTRKQREQCSNIKSFMRISFAALAWRPLLTDEVGTHELLQVKGQGRRRDVEFLANRARGKAFRTALHEQPEDGEPRLL